jgi:tetratricopeptide (TPR) repeat protein
LSNLAFACQKIGKFEKALDCYKKAASLDPSDAGIYYNWALILARTGKKTDAIEVIHKALKAVPVTSPGLKTIKDLLERLKG